MSKGKIEARIREDLELDGQLRAVIRVGQGLYPALGVLLVIAVVGMFDPRVTAVGLLVFTIFASGIRTFALVLTDTALYQVRKSGRRLEVWEVFPLQSLSWKRDRFSVTLDRKRYWVEPRYLQDLETFDRCLQATASQISLAGHF